MITLILAAATAIVNPPPLTDPFEQAAYVSGRCSPWMTTFLEDEIIADMKGISPKLIKLFDQGKADSNVDPLSYELCNTLMKGVTVKVQQAKDTGKTYEGK